MAERHGSRPTFSVVIPTRGRPDLVALAVSDVLGQTYPAHEVIVVVDGPDPETVDRLNDLPDERLVVVEIESSGPGGARNAGVRRATGEWIVFLDDDDRVDDDWLDGLAELAAAPGTGLVRCCARIVDVTNASSAGQADVSPPIVPAGVGIVGTFGTRRAIFDRVGGYDEQLSYGENTELCLRLAAECDRRGLDIRSTSRVLMSFCRYDRKPYAPSGRLASALRVLDKDAELLETQPEYRANLCGIVGVNAARVGDRSTALRYLGRAALYRPLRLRPWLRLFTAAVPPLSRRVWSSDQ